MSSSEPELIVRVCLGRCAWSMSSCAIWMPPSRASPSPAPLPPQLGSAPDAYSCSSSKHVWLRSAHPVMSAASVLSFCTRCCYHMQAP
eukprot:1152706-Pelagomonas_calceolata.AAC.2